MATPKIFTLFKNVTIPPAGNALGPAGGLDLTGYSNYRLVLRFDGPAGTKFTINELYGPAGGIDQLNTDIDTGKIDTLGSLNYRRKFDIFGPKNFFIRIFNNGTGPIKVNGSLYAV
jgi:hypothetical protein